VVEDCVNAVGVDLNTASVPLLTRVSGLSGTVAQGIVRWRDAHGAFRNRKQLLDVAAAWAPRPSSRRRLPAHPRRRQPARHDRRAPRNLPGGGTDHRRNRQARDPS
jgi:predicted amino acid dehydrogenase